MSNTKTLESRSAYAKGQAIGLLVFAIIFGAILLFSSALSNASAASAELSKSYRTDADVLPGNLVSSVDGKDGYVELANARENNQLVGVAVKSEESLVEVNKTTGTVQVATSGLANALVSTLGGDIKKDDLVAISSVTGVGAKARPGDKVIGVAQADFNSSTSNTTKKDITDLNGKTQQITIGYVPVSISVGVMPGSSNFGGVPKGVEKWATAIAGREVSLARLIICAIIAIVAIVSLATMVYSAIRSSMTASSRNPLAKPVILESLAQVMAMVALISIISVTIMYAILRI